MIELKSVTKKFNEAIALDNINLNIETGKAYGLLGSNGAGKSTILRLLSGVYQCEKGDVLIDGEKVYDNPLIKERVVFVNDETVQFNTYTLDELKDFYKAFYPTFSEERFEKLWGILRLPRNRRLSTYSKGMKRQAVLICSIACQPKYLLLDEAFDGIDPTMRIVVKKMLVDAMLDNELTVIISSHNLGEIDEFCDTVGLLHKGKIIFNRELDSVKGNIHKIQTAFDRNYEKADFDDFEVMHYEKKGSVIYLIAKGDTDDITEKLSRKNPKILDIIPLSLEEIFIYEMEVLGYEFNDININ
ncbi:MAG: ABC transporter ATP-binding protein [Clostridiales bacterium]|nr:ABC transporter ATP-binding protein [Clostridiales bacterium]